jgi:hypothetical protein
MNFYGYDYASLMEWSKKENTLSHETLMVWTTHQHGNGAYTFNDLCDAMSTCHRNDTMGANLTHEHRKNVKFILPALCKAEDEIAALKAELAAAKERLAVYEEKERLEQEELARRKAEEERLAAEAEAERKKPFLQRLRSFF